MNARHARFAAIAGAITLVAGSSATTVVSAAEEFDFPALRLPIPAGPGYIINGYDDEEDGGFHRGGEVYALDFCDANSCEIGDPILAPTDLRYMRSGDYNAVPGDEPDYHVFSIAEVDDKRLCVALAHFELIGREGLSEGDAFAQGTTLGYLLDYPRPSVPHGHIGMWVVQGVDGCPPGANPVAFVGRYALDGVDYPPDEDHEYQRIMSTNANTDEIDMSSPLSQSWRTPTGSTYAWSPMVEADKLLVGVFDEQGETNGLVLEQSSGVAALGFGQPGQSNVGAATVRNTWGSTKATDSGASFVVAGGNLAIVPGTDQRGQSTITPFRVVDWKDPVAWEARPPITLDAPKAEIAVCGDTIIVAAGAYRGDADQGVAIGFDTTRFREQWRHASDTDDLLQPTIVGGTAYFGSYKTGGGAKIIGRDCSSGDLVLEYADDQMWNIDSPTIHDGLAISGAFAYDIDEGGMLLAVDIASEELKWRKTYGLDAMYSPTAVDGILYAGSYDNQGEAELVAVKPTNGKVVWRWPVPGGGLPVIGVPGQENVSSPTAYGSALLTGVGSWRETDDGALLIYDLDGELLNEFKPNPPVDVVFSPSVANGIAYAGTSDADGASVVAIQLPR